MPHSDSIRIPRTELTQDKYGFEVLRSVCFAMLERPSLCHRHLVCAPCLPEKTKYAEAVIALAHSVGGNFNLALS